MVFPLLFTLVNKEPAALLASWSANGEPPVLKPPLWLSTLNSALFFDIPKAQRARIQLVLFSVRSAANHRPIELRMITDGDIKTAFACINKRQFEAISQLDEKEREAIETVINSILHMHDAKRWTTKSN